MWKSFKNIIIKAAVEIAGHQIKTKRQTWMTDEIFDLMEERKFAKISDI